MNRDLRMMETKVYKYVNVNPKNKYGGDCVIRAIANALNQTWEQTVRELTELGIKKGLVCNDRKLYPKYLESKGFVPQKEPRNEFNRKITIKNWIENNNINKGIYVVNAGSHHVVCIKNGMVEDIWDSSRSIMHKYWKLII